ncbi:hypothetical protein ElyMa_000142100 [Elysia marginata]|uniref:EGF-like domain-containing protein n=1 Tax=Elysia marginata TaxID=1093978 RepID=A0AAV4EQ88_9GAST|nr:hypothetical protein ElyMa_000142100 [Elysia marginata]
MHITIVEEWEKLMDADCWWKTRSGESRVCMEVGDYCECNGKDSCSKEWTDPRDNKSLSWQHYERAHWSVQYKLCRPLTYGHDCEKSELGALVQTAVAEWAPDLTLPRCKCSDDSLYRLTGWKRKGAIWEYTYTCNKMKFKCSCPEGYLCPAKYNEKEDDSRLESDEEQRSYVPKECETIVKRKRTS